MLHELSMVLFMKNNAHMIDSIIEYHAHTQVQLYILHDADTAYFTQETHEKYDNVHYYHFHNSTILERFQFIQSKIATEYFVFRSDRRHPTNTSLIRSLEFLKNNSDYSSVSGIWLFEDKTPSYSIDVVNQSGEHDNKATRISNAMLASQPHFYNVHRTSLMKAYIESQSRIHAITENIYFSEYVHKFILSFIGKTRSIPFLAGIIQDKNTHSEYHHEILSVIPLLQNKAITEEISCIIKDVLRKNNFNIEHFEEGIQAWYDSYTIFLNIKRCNREHVENAHVKTFGFMESIYLEMNKATICPEMLEKHLKCYMYDSFTNNIKYEYIQHLFDKDDMQEMITLMRHITKLEALKQLIAYKNINAQLKKARNGYIITSPPSHTQNH